MIPVINAADKILQAAASRYGEVFDRDLRLSASALAFDVALDGSVSPPQIVFIASMLGVDGTATFTTDDGTPVSVAGNVATLLPSALIGNSCVVTATMVVQGERFVASRSVLKVLAFDPSMPPAPAGLVTVGRLASVLLSWSPTNDANLAKVEIWRSLTNSLAGAAAVGSTSGLATSYSDNIGAAGSFFYWIRYISKANVTGPFNSVVGTAGEAGTDANHLLDLLVNRITESQLLAALREKIALVTDPESMPGSVSARIKTETDARVAAITQESAARINYVQTYAYSKVGTDSAISLQAATTQAQYTAYADAARANAISVASADVRTYAYSQAATDSALAAQASTLRAEFASVAGVSEAYVQNYAYSKAAFDSAQASQSSAITAAYTGYADAARTNAISVASADVRSYAYSKVTIDSAFSSQSSQIQAAYSAARGEAIAAASADVRSYAYSQAGTNSAIAAATTTLTSTVGDHTTTLQQQATTIGGLSGQLTWKIDVNGYVTGIGLASTEINGTPTSDVIINAANFAVVSPGASPRFMFGVAIVNGATVIALKGTAVVSGSVLGGAMTGNAWPAAGGGAGYYMGGEGVKVGNKNDGKWFEADVNGNISMPGFSITAGGAPVITSPRVVSPVLDPFALVAPGDTDAYGPNASALGATLVAAATGGQPPYTFTWSAKKISGGPSSVAVSLDTLIGAQVGLVCTPASNLTVTAQAVLTVHDSGGRSLSAPQTVYFHFGDI